jgi:hypothetical protein
VTPAENTTNPRRKRQGVALGSVCRFDGGTEYPIPLQGKVRGKMRTLRYSFSSEPVSEDFAAGLQEGFELGWTLGVRNPNAR